MKIFQDLANKFYSLSFSLKLRSIFIKIIAFALTIAVFIINISWVDSSDPNIISHIVSTIAATLAVPALFMIISSPLTNMAISSFYLKSRQAKGNFGHSATGEEAKIASNTLFTTKRKIFTAASLALTFVVSNLAYISMVTPMAKPMSVARPIIEKVDSSENAWTQYDLAIHDLLETPVLSRLGSNNLEKIHSNIFQKVQSSICGSLEKVASGQAELTDEQSAFLEKHQGAINHLLLAAKLPKAQYYDEMPNLATPVPNLLEMRALANLAGAKVQQLKQQGKIKEAVELALANYKMAVDIGTEKNTTLISALISVVCRGITAKSLISLINSGVTTAEMDKEIARQVSEQNSRMPNAYQLLSWEQQSFQASLEDSLIKENFASLSGTIKQNVDLAKIILKPFPGLRVRAYNKYVDLSQYHLNLMRNDLENWDFAAANTALAQFIQKKQSWNSPSNIESILTAPIFSMFYETFPNSVATMKSLYLCDAVTKTVVSFAACSAYKKNHNQFPATLELATSEIGLPTIQDLATKQPIGYRLENGNPIVWFAGVDGKNDGGLQTYDRVNFNSPAVGKDLIFTYGQLLFKD